MNATTLPLPNGATIDFLNPRPEDIDLNFVCSRLAQIRRWTGNPRAIMVDAHSWHVSENMRRAGFSPAVQLVALLHDGHEAYTGDLTSPFRRALAKLAGVDVVTSIQHLLDGAIFNAAGVPSATILDPKIELIVREYDLRARGNELAERMGEDPVAWNCTWPPLPYPIPPGTDAEASSAFRSRLVRLMLEVTEGVQ